MGTTDETILEKDAATEKSTIEGAPSIVGSVMKINGSKFVVGFIVFSAVISLIFGYSIYRSFKTRPNIKIEDEK